MGLPVSVTSPVSASMLKNSKSASARLKVKPALVSPESVAVAV